MADLQEMAVAEVWDAEYAKKNRYDRGLANAKAPPQ